MRLIQMIGFVLEDIADGAQIKCSYSIIEYQVFDKCNFIFQQNLVRANQVFYTCV